LSHCAWKEAKWLVMVWTFFADRLEMVQAFLETEVVEIVVWTPLRAREAEWELGTLATDKYLRHSRRAENHYAA
jgi:hypothetical protein